MENIDCRNELDKIYEQTINGARLRSKCDWYKYDEKRIKCHKRINQELIGFYKNLLSENLNVPKNEIMQFLNLTPIPQLTENQSRDCEFILKDLLLYQPVNHPVTTFLQKNSIRFSRRILKPLLYQVLNQHLIKTNSVISKRKS